jgi:hypothetical protein
MSSERRTIVPRLGKVCAASGTSAFSQRLRLLRKMAELLSVSVHFPAGCGVGRLDDGTGHGHRSLLRQLQHSVLQRASLPASVAEEIGAHEMQTYLNGAIAILAVVTPPA